MRLTSLLELARLKKEGKKRKKKTGQEPSGEPQKRAGYSPGKKYWSLENISIVRIPLAADRSQMYSGGRKNTTFQENIS
jgi:hypothetical protein